MIDLYCERQGPGLWAEPLNAVTNLAFLVAAWATWRLLRRSARRPVGVWILLILTVGVGLGSGLFHTFATPWARVLDLLPILLFQLAYLWGYARRMLAFGRLSAAGMLGAFLLAALLGRQFPTVLNGSLLYAPAALVLLGLGAAHRAVARREPFGLLAAGTVFLIAVAFRSLDRVVCADIPLGTHFLWHLSTALVLYLASRALLLNWPGARAETEFYTGV